MPRTSEQIGQLAFKIFEALSKVKFSYDDLKSLGECIYANDPTKAAEDKKDFTEQSKALLTKVRQTAVVKLYKASQDLDTIFPLPETAELEALRARKAELEALIEKLQAPKTETPVNGTAEQPKPPETTEPSNG